MRFDFPRHAAFEYLKNPNFMDEFSKFTLSGAYSMKGKVVWDDVFGKTHRLEFEGFVERPQPMGHDDHAREFPLRVLTTAVHIGLTAAAKAEARVELGDRLAPQFSTL